MKFNYFIFFLFFISITSEIYAQVPEKMSYQAVVRDANNNLVTNHEVGIQITIIQGSASGNEAYKEIFSPNPQTNENGLLTIEIGGGTPTLGQFTTIDWTAGPYFIKTDIDPTGGINYTITGTSQLLSVPYAFHAKTAENITGNINESDPVFSSSVAGAITTNDTTNWNNKLSSEVDGSVINEIQTLSISNDTIYLSNGGFVKLPATYTSLLPPTIIIDSASNIGPSTAVLNGFVNANNLLSSVSFDWGLTTDYGNNVQAIQNPVTGTSETPVSASINGLQYNTTYHYRIKASNAVNISYSDEMSFTTPFSPPILTTNFPVQFPQSATCGGNITDDGGFPVTARGVCWSTSHNPTLANEYTVDGSGTGNFTSNIAGLENGTLYYVRAYATNSIGTGYGNEYSFTTPDIPVLSIYNLTNFKGTLVTASSTVDQNCYGITQEGFCWSSTNPNPTLDDNFVSINNGQCYFDCLIDSLTPSTVYYIRAFAINNIGIGYSSTSTFNSGYELGSFHEGGLVFYNDGAGHGFVCSDSDIVTNVTWGCDSVLIGTSTEIGTGEANTLAIVNNCADTAIAAKICYDLVLNSYDDWYLPSKDEIYLIWNNIQDYITPSMQSLFYWSSSEIDEYHIWTFASINNKWDNGGVRAIRAF